MSAHERSRAEKVDETIQLADRVSRELLLMIPKELTSSQIMELTMAQFKIVLILYVGGTAKMSLLASQLDVSLPTTTGIVDRLVERGLVEREEDVADRRVVLCKLSEKGNQMFGGLWQTARDGVRDLLMAVPEEKLPLVDQALKILSEAGQQNISPEE
jgi:DNA-binding MarR family transcriptional regulator